MATAGKILMFPVGNWTSGNNYGFLDIVYYGGSSYVAKTDITNSTTNPATDTTNWQILAHGYIADTLSGIDGIDTSGLIGTAGAIVSSQALMDKIADMVATKLVLKTAISNQQVNDTTKITGSALAYSMGQSIDTLNSNLTVVSDNLAVIGTTLVSSTAAQGSVANEAVINDLSLSAGTWIVSAYANSAKISLQNNSQTVLRMGVNPFVVTNGPINLQMVNRSGSAITRFADGSNYYIIAVRIK